MYYLNAGGLLKGLIFLRALKGLAFSYVATSKLLNCFLIYNIIMNRGSASRVKKGKQGETKNS